MQTIEIDWKYFFGGSGDGTFDRYYKAEINGVRVEKHASNRSTKYAIGNIDQAKKKFKTEAELLAALQQPNKEDMELTAVDFLIHNIVKDQNEKAKSKIEWLNIFTQAKAMDKKQKSDEYWKGWKAYGESL